MAGDRVELGAQDSVGSQVPSVAGVTERDALIKRPRTEGNRAIHVDIDAQQVTDAEIITEIPGELNPAIRIKQASEVGRVLNARFNRDDGGEGGLQSCAEDFPGSGPYEYWDIDADTGAFRARAPASPVHCIGEIEARRGRRKTKESGKHPDRDAQFEYINAKVEEFQAADQPVISIDAKKKELLGEFKNGGSDYGPQGRPIEVNTHDFEDKELGKVVPYGVYDIGANDGYVSLGIDHDTGQFAVNSVRLWLDRIGRERYCAMKRLMITADGGGSNGSRLRLWKMALQQLADETGLIIQVCHYPPGTSKWNKIEHRMFCYITPELARHASRQPYTS